MRVLLVGLLLAVAVLAPGFASAQDPPADVRTDGDARGQVAAVSLFGSSTATGFCLEVRRPDIRLEVCWSGALAASGLGTADGGLLSMGGTGATARHACVEFALVGIAEVIEGCYDGAAIAAMGSANGGLVAASGTGSAAGAPSECNFDPFTHCMGGLVAVSGGGQASQASVAASLLGGAAADSASVCAFPVRSISGPIVGVIVGFCTGGLVAFGGGGGASGGVVNVGLGGDATPSPRRSCVGPILLAARLGEEGGGGAFRLCPGGVVAVGSGSAATSPTCLDLFLGVAFSDCLPGGPAVAGGGSATSAGSCFDAGAAGFAATYCGASSATSLTGPSQGGVAVSPEGFATGDALCVGANTPLGVAAACPGGLAVGGAGAAGGIAVSATGPVSGGLLAASGTGAAQGAPVCFSSSVLAGGCLLAGISASGTGDASGAAAVSGTGDASGLVAVSLTGDARGTVAVSGTGRAYGEGGAGGNPFCLIPPLEVPVVPCPGVAVSACNANEMLCRDL